MSGLKKKGPARRAPKRARSALDAGRSPTMESARRYNKRGSEKEFFFDNDY